MLIILLGLLVAWICCLIFFVKGLKKRSWWRMVLAIFAAIAAYYFADWIRIQDNKFVDEQIHQGKGTLLDYDR